MWNEIKSHLSVGANEVTDAKFGRFPVGAHEVFLASPHALAITNLKCYRPGHVLVLSRRCVPRLEDLNKDERHGLIELLRLTTCLVEEYYGADNGTAVILQDGPAAGQTVPHVHFHVTPRIPKKPWKPHLQKLFEECVIIPEWDSPHLALQPRARSSEEREKEKAEYVAFTLAHF